MFSGIVEVMGRIGAVEDLESTRRFRIDVGPDAGAPLVDGRAGRHEPAPGFAEELAIGDSVAVDGACLTVTEVHERGFFVDVIGTTLSRTIAGGYQEGSTVNLERALRMGGRVDGHLVQGHVDGVGRLTRVDRDGEYWLMDFEIPADVHAGTLEHGSITLNGVSLTVSELLDGRGVRIGVIPHTHAHTNLGDLAPDDPVNVEGDMIGKYVARFLAQRTNAEPG